MNPKFYLHTYPGMLVTLLFIWITLIGWNLRSARAVLNRYISRKGLAVLCSLVLVSLIWRLFVVKPRHLVYFDEFVHMDVAMNFAKTNAFGDLLFADKNSPPVVQVPSWPGGFHILLGLVYKVIGANELAAFRFNAIVGSFSVVLVFLIATLMYENQASGLWAAFLLATLPLHLRYSATTDLTVFSAFCILMTIFATLLFLKTRSKEAYFLLLASVAYAVNTRFENVLLIPFCAAVLWKHLKNEQYVRPRGYIVLHVLFLWAIIPAIMIFFINRNVDVPGYSDSIGQMLHNASRNLPGNFLYLVRQPHKSLFLLPFTLLTIARAGRAFRSWTLLIAGLGLAYVLAGSLHIYGDFTRPNFSRLALPWLLCLLIAASYSLSSIGTEKRPLNCVLLATVSIILCWPAYQEAPVGSNDRELEFTRTADLPPDSIVISNCPAFIWIEAKRSSLSAQYFNHEGAGSLIALLQANRPVYLYKGSLWRQHPETSVPVEATLRQGFRIEPAKVASFNSDEYGYYRLTPLSPRGRVSVGD